MVEEEQQPTERKPKRSDKYKCPRCGNTITVHVRVSEPPLCSNTSAHSQSLVEMELTKK